VRSSPARTLAAAGTALIGAVAAAAAYLVVGGLAGLLYAAGICLAAFVGAVAIVAGRTEQEPTKHLPEPAVATAPRQPPWGRKSRRIAELTAELTETTTELEEHRRAIANLAAQLARESEAAGRNAQRLEQEIRELEIARNDLKDLVVEERGRFERTLDELGGGIGRHGNELAELEKELEALIAR
jgi:flagellar motility protein MotE (MotC chaperone)